MWRKLVDGMRMKSLATRPGAPPTHVWRTHPPGVVGDDVISSRDAASVTVGQAGV